MKTISTPASSSSFSSSSSHSSSSSFFSLKKWKLTFLHAINILISVKLAGNKSTSLLWTCLPQLFAPSPFTVSNLLHFGLSSASGQVVHSDSQEDVQQDVCPQNEGVTFAPLEMKRLNLTFRPQLDQRSVYNHHWSVDGLLEKDTVTTHEEDDKVHAHHHVGEDGPPVGHDAVVHHSIPVLSCENLQRQTIRHELPVTPQHLEQLEKEKRDAVGIQLTWKQVSRAWGKESNVLLFICISSKLNLPPNTCMPSRAKMMRKRKSSRRREQIAFMELSSELTRSDRAAQCLRATGEQRHTSGDAHRTGGRWQPSRFSSVFQLPCHLEYPDQADAAQHGDADGGDRPDLHE